MSELNKRKINKWEESFGNWRFPIFVLDAKGIVQFQNKPAVKIFGKLKSISELVGSSKGKITTPRTFQKEWLKEPALYEGIFLKTEVYDLSLSEVGKGLKVIEARPAATRMEILQNAEKLQMKLNQLLTESEAQKRELEFQQRQLVQEGKLLALGDLASGMAHEINQPLTVIRGYSQELQRTYGKIEATHEIIQAVDRVTRIVQALRRHADSSTQEETWIDLDDLSATLHYTYVDDFSKKGLTLKFHPIGSATRKAHWFGPLGFLELILMNLISNARDASLKGGIVEVKYSLNSKYLTFTVEDQGVGIPKEKIAQILQPFYTTKNPGEGMGLGLYLVDRIVKTMQGSLDIQSTEKSGTKMTVQLPVKQK